jgi:hypothetical protein
MYKILGADQKEYGPVTAEEVRLWIAQRRVHAQSLAQAQSTNAWQPLSFFPEFAAALVAIAPAPSPAAASAVVAAEQRPNSMATAGLVMSCLALICCGGCAPFAVLGIVFSIVGLTQANRDPAETGKGLAIAGLVIGIISLLGTIAGTFATMVLGIFGALIEGLQR